MCSVVFRCLPIARSITQHLEVRSLLHRQHTESDHTAAPTAHGIGSWWSLVDPGLLEGPHHRVDDEVTNDGAMNHFLIRSDYGELEAPGPNEQALSYSASPSRASASSSRSVSRRNSE